MRAVKLALALVLVGSSVSGCASLRDFFGFERAAAPAPVVRVAPPRNPGPVAAPSVRVREQTLDEPTPAEDALLGGQALASASSAPRVSSASSLSASGLLGGADAGPAPRAPLSTACSQGPARTVVVQPGDTISGIVMREYGDYGQLDQIIQANLDRLPNPNQISPGLELRLPGTVRQGCRPA